MKTLLLCILGVLAVSVRGVETNKIVSINLSTTLEYNIQFVGSKDDSTAHFIPMSARWKSPGKSGHDEIYVAMFENFPFIRTRWAAQGGQGLSSIYYVPLYPIQGRARIVSADDHYDQYGNPTTHVVHYLWITNAIETEKAQLEQAASDRVAQEKAQAEAKAKAAAQIARALQANQDAAAKGDMFGLLRMGERYRDGEGVDKDLNKARDYFQKAADAGSPTAKEELSKLPRQ